MMMPDYITIGTVAYTVHEVDRLTDEGKPMLGMIHYNAGRIEIDAGMPDAIKLVTLWHEVIHGICHQSGVKHSEAVVQALSYGLVDLFAANRWTIAMGDANAHDA